MRAIGAAPIQAAIVIVTVVAIAAIAAKTLDSLEKTRLETTADSLGRVAAASDVLVAQIRAQAAIDASRADSMVAVVEAIERDLAAANARTAQVVVRVDSARATVDEDTLSVGLRGLLAVERLMAASHRSERDLERDLRQVVEGELARCRPILAATQVLLVQVQGERDAFQAALEDALDQLQPGFWRGLLLDLPEIGGAAGAGAVVAALNDGDVLLGAGIGAAAALAIKAVF